MIAHIDADSFFASVLARKNPALRGKPLLALGMGGGCVIAASYEAKTKGVKTGMRLRDALALVPDAARLPSDFQETGLASEQIEAIIRERCPNVEQMSIDEWFLDLPSLVGGIPDDLTTFATDTRTIILQRTGLSVSVGIGPTKTLAKMASEYRKPGGVTVVEPSARHPAIDIQSFLTDRPAAAIPGIGRQRMTHCEREKWRTAWDIASAHPEQLRQLFGKTGNELGRELRGEAVYAIATETQPPQSVSRARSFRAEGDTRILWAHTLRHLEYTVLKMRRWKLACKGVSVWLRDGQYRYESTHHSLPRPFETEETLQPFVRNCFGKLYEPGKTYTQTGVALWHLVPGGVRQFSLFEKPEKALQEETLQDSLDELHERFGRNAITRGSALPIQTGTQRGFDMSAYKT